MTTIHDFTADRLTGQPVSLAEWRGQVLLVVNTASKCGFTPQYAGLQSLHDRYAARGFAVLGFPCDQFGHQEPGGAEEIGAFCERNYGVGFPMFAKVEVNGDGAHPLFKWLRREARGFLGTTRIKWNFTKFLIDRGGRPVRRFATLTKPEAIAPRIDMLL